MIFCFRIALIFDPQAMDGTATPSTESTDNDGKCWRVANNGQPFAKVSLTVINVKYRVQTYSFLDD